MTATHEPVCIPNKLPFLRGLTAWCGHCPSPKTAPAAPGFFIQFCMRGIAAAHANIAVASPPPDAQGILPCYPLVRNNG